MINRFILCFLFSVLFFSFSFSQSAKTIYTVQTKEFDAKGNLTVGVQDEKPFSVNLNIGKDSTLKKAISFINDLKAQSFNSGESLVQNDFVFSSQELKSVTVKFQVAKKKYAKADPLKMLILSYGESKKDTLNPKDLDDYIKEKGIAVYSITPISIQSPVEQVTLDSTNDYTLTFINDNDTSRNTNLLIGSLIKSLAGARPQDELIDLFIKLNYGKQKRFFSLLGADAGIGSNKDTSTSSGLFRINEAIANFNYAFYNGRKFKLLKLHNRNDNKARGDTIRLNDSLKIENLKRFDDLKRTAFLGAGLKIFGSIPYVGAHFGSIEINGPLYGSYILVGYYRSPYLETTTSKDSITYQSFRNNIYLEAALNAFGSKVPSVLKTIKVKFGLMFPIKGKSDIDKPGTKDIISRLAIEVPLGSIFRF